MSDRMVFSTYTLPERDRFAAFCEEIVRRYTGLDLTTKDRNRFHATLELQRAGAIDIGRNWTSPVDSARTADLVRDGDDALLVTLVERGRAHQTQREDGQVLFAGDAIICDCGYPGELNVIADARFWQLKVPRRNIASLFPPATRFAGARLDRNSTALRLLFGYLGGAFGIDLCNGGDATRLYQGHLVDLIALALGAEGEARALVEQRGVRAVRRAAIIHEIETSMAEPALDAQAVALRLGITARYVHILLQETGRTFSEHLLEKRLARAAELLRDPRLGGFKIADIAFQVGFADLSHFNRSFRRKFGATPTDLREAAQKHRRD